MKQSASHTSCADECAEKWEDMHEELLGIGSLKMWAKEDNPDAYEDVKKTDLYHHVIKSCAGGKGSSYDVAKIMNLMYSDFFICVSVKDDKWYYYDNELNRWNMDDKGIRLKEKISTEVWKTFNRYQIDENNKAMNDPQGADSQYALNAMNISKVMNRLKDTPLKVIL